jgi:hypothetical protein
MGIMFGIILAPAAKKSPFMLNLENYSLLVKHVFQKHTWRLSFIRAAGVLCIINPHASGTLLKIISVHFGSFDKFGFILVHFGNQEVLIIRFLAREQP